MEARVNFKNVEENLIKRGQIWMVDLGEAKGSIQGGVRPVIIIQNNIGNKFAPTINVVAITGQKSKKRIPSHFIINRDCGVIKESTVLCEQQFTLNKTQLISCVGQLTKEKEKELAQCLRIQLAIVNEDDDNDDPSNNAMSVPTKKEDKQIVRKDFMYIQKCLDTMETMKNNFEESSNVIYLDVFRKYKEELEEHCDKTRMNKQMYLRKYTEFIAKNLGKII